MKLRPGLAPLLASLLLASAVVGLAAPPAGAHDGRGVILGHERSAEPAPPGYEPPPPETLGGKPFELVDHTGRAVTEATFRGRWQLMFFGFTGCREACPLALERMGLAIDALGEAGKDVQPLFVDLDYAGPDLPGLAQFVEHFHPRLLGLTGERRQVFLILRDFQIRRELRHGLHGRKETGPRIDHTTYIFVVDPEGRTRSYFHHSLTPDAMAAHIRLQLAAHRP